MSLVRRGGLGFRLILIPGASLLASACEGPPQVESQGGTATSFIGETVEPERAEVTRLAYDFMRALSERDTASLGGLLASHASLFSIREGESGPQYAVRTREEFLQDLSQGGTPFQERIWEPTVEVSGRIAMVWAPYDFHLDGAFSHCGIDVLAFMKMADGWKVTSITYNVVREGCPARPVEGPEG